MAGSNDCYTYQDGEKLELKKRPSEFVIRALPDDVRNAGLGDGQRMSSVSTRVAIDQPGDLDQAMERARGVAVTHHAYEVAETGQEFLITDRILVTFHRAMAPEEVDAFAGRYGLLQKTAYSDREYLFQLTNHTGMNPVKLVVRLMEQDDAVETAEHDLNVRAMSSQLELPLDPSYARQWHLHQRFQNPDFDPRSSTACEQAWMALNGYGSPEVVVGVTDDGCKLDHSDFDSGAKFRSWGYFQGERLVTRDDVDADPARMFESGSTHGTSCAGVIAAERDASLTVGAAPGCRLLPIKWQSDGPSLFISGSKLRTAIEFVADKVDVLSNSWGVVPRSVWPSLVTRRIRELSQTGGRRGRGILFLWAAGNENCPVQHDADEDVPFTDGWEWTGTNWRWIGVTTARRFRNSLVGIPGVMHVAALASNARRSHYSNYGTGIDLCAPTNNIHTYSRLSVKGLGITAATGPSDFGNRTVTHGFGGTSSATPLVAGVAALVISANPELSAADVQSILKTTASTELDFTGYPRTPPAVFDPDPDWDVSPIEPFADGSFRGVDGEDGDWSPWFGRGRVDARAAVGEALSRLPAPPDEESERRHDSAPELAIPDNDPQGVTDTITVGRGGLLRGIRVGLDITHTWIGDLVVRLTSPAGTTVTLHDRQGGSADNLVHTYAMAGLPELGSLRDQGIRGDWVMSISDRAGADRGILNSWALEFDAAPEPLAAEDATSVRIPDDSPAGIVRSLSLPSGSTIRDIAVAVDITHTWIGDLRVTLGSPAGRQVRLHNRVGGRRDNIVRTYSSAELDDLRSLRGQEAGGEWTLHVADLVRRDTGKLNRWRIEIAV